MSTEANWRDLPLTVRELRILKHTLGVDRSDRNGGRCPKEFYRNGFCAGNERNKDYAQLKCLEDKGLMSRYDRGDEMGGLWFLVTDLGIKLVREFVGSLYRCKCGKDIVPFEMECMCYSCCLDINGGHCPLCHEKAQP